MGNIGFIGPNKPGVANVMATLDAAKSFASEAEANQCVIILLKNDGKLYQHRLIQAGMVSSEIVALLEIQKSDVIGAM